MTNEFSYTWLFRIISNYEYCINEFVPSNVLLDAALKEKVNLTAISLGMLIQDIWEGKVKKQKKDHGSRFLNLRKRSID